MGAQRPGAVVIVNEAYWGWCPACDWMGPVRLRESIADADAEEHDREAAHGE